MCVCMMTKGSQKLAVSVVVACKVKLTNLTKFFHYFSKDPFASYKESGTCESHQMVSGRGARGESMQKKKILNMLF